MLLKLVLGTLCAVLAVGAVFVAEAFIFSPDQKTGVYLYAENDGNGAVTYYIWNPEGLPITLEGTPTKTTKVLPHWEIMPKPDAIVESEGIRDAVLVVGKHTIIPSRIGLGTDLPVLLWATLEIHNLLQADKVQDKKISTLEKENKLLKTELADLKKRVKALEPADPISDNLPPVG